MTDQVELVLGGILRPQERIQSVLHTFARPTGSDSAIDPWTAENAAVSADATRFLALVTHNDELGGHEEGG